MTHQEHSHGCTDACIWDLYQYRVDYASRTRHRYQLYLYVFDNFVEFVFVLR